MKQQRNLSVLLVALACTMAALFTALFLCYLPFNRALVARRDFIVYWATGQQLVRHGNPYDPPALQKIEDDAGYADGGSFFMRNIPWALPLAYPLGFLNPQIAALPWSLAMLGLLFLSIRILLKMIPDPGGTVAWLGYCFPPALFCVILGQTSIILLLGLVLFLRWHRTRPLPAGAALWLCTLKPHLFLPFGLIVLVWIVVSRSYRILVGGVLAATVGTVLTTAVDPRAWSQYAYYVRTSVMTREFTPNFGDLLRDRINPSAEWIAFVPAMIGGVWALAYFWPRRHTWDWLENGSPLLLVSLLVAPFGWIFDQSVAVPAVMLGASKTASKAMLALIAVIYIAIEIQINRSNLHSAAYLWVAPAWLIWYVCARAVRAGVESPQGAEEQALEGPKM